ncbi:hypothetical protein F2P56_018763 [Juglans regia]|uniref:Uncharacterized protein LOC108990992 n=2 Tax=Juglans regia TaxID=51240 RepID=A0A2I4EMR0_JUGRE|nr:uncharacterized protein LOC108990992 [Juglans regia]KAF5462782.1 hypothetical protein F2P56_018763 [Juglans regia]
MECSSEWKSAFPVSAVFTPPLHLSGPSSRQALGPLVFNPKPQTLTHLFYSQSLLPHSLSPPPHLSLPKFLLNSSIPPSTSSSVSSLVGHHAAHQNDAASHLLHNRLSFLQQPNSKSVIVFFPTGVNFEQVGFLVLLLDGSGSSFDVRVDKKGSVFREKTGFEYRINNISVNPIVESSFESNSSAIVGYLMVSTLYSVHWFAVMVKEIGLNWDSPSLVCLGSKVFKSCSVVCACWSPYVPEESVVLLESGSLFLFVLESCLKSFAPSARFRGTRLRVSWDDESGTSGSRKWLGCEFSWHLRILIVARSDAVFLVDLRLDECVVICLAKVEMLSNYASVENERFLRFMIAGSDGFHFALASHSLLLLCDVRKPMMPMLHWAHGLDKPCYIDVFRLSELRSNSRNETYQWASESGFCIILGSFWNCEFNLFCYGPALPAPRGNIASEISEFSETIYAWGLPTDLLLSGRECRCGSCLVREEILKDDLPEWIDWQQKKEIVLGFGILNKGLSAQLAESDEFGGFTLIRLMSSGKLELQRYCASWDPVKKLKEFHREFLQFEDNFLFTTEDGEYRFPRRFKYLNFDNLSAYLNGNLTKVLDSKIKNHQKGPQEKETFSTEAHEILCEKLKAYGFGRLRSSPAVAVAFDDISLPASIHEVALRRLWAGLPIELLQLAYSYYPEFLEVLVDQKKVALEFLVVPDLPQLPPFFLRKPSHRSNKWSWKVQRDDALVGPVLPLPILLALHEYRNDYSDLEGMDGFSLEKEFSLRCDEVKQVASELAVPDSGCELRDDGTVSLADDREETRGSSEKPKPFCLYTPVAFKYSTMDNTMCNTFSDKNLDILIFKVHEKKHVPPGKMETGVPELFDDLCSTELRFDACVKNTGQNELKAYNILKRQWSKWQDGFSLYQEFCPLTKFQKQST